MNSSSHNILYFGKPEPLPEKSQLKAGPLEAIFEAGELRRITFNGIEMIRGIYMAVRDPKWNTVIPKLANLNFQCTPDQFQISFDAIHEEAPVSFEWKGHIEGNASGHLSFVMDGYARSSFLTNRTGFCVLHPPQTCAGQPCGVEHPDGSRETIEFPKFISPHQPMMNIRKLSYRDPDSRVQASIAFEGDVFEMEDQRNWTDDSFKTYCTPLALPMPRELQAGAHLQQSIHVDFQALQELQGIPDNVGDLRFSMTGNYLPIPSLGTQFCASIDELDSTQKQQIQKLNFKSLRGHVDLSKQDWNRVLHKCLSQARGLHLPMDLSIASCHLEPELLRLLDEIKNENIASLSIVVPQSPAASEMVRKVLRPFAQSKNIPLGACSIQNFTELNRNRPDPATVDFIGYSLNPQVHAFDNTTLIENLDGQKATLDTCKQLFSNLPISVGPITLRMQYREQSGGNIPASVDVRQMSLFAAGWTLISLKKIADPQVQRAILFETAGWRGLVGFENAPPFMPGKLFPIYHILALAGNFDRLQAGISSNPRRLDGVTFANGSRRCTVLANFTSECVNVHFSHPLFATDIRHLNASTYADAAADPDFMISNVDNPETMGATVEKVHMEPFAITRLNWVE